ncbi:hypothetical protein AWZ03_008582 [Drosophila navojoa]|uniref:Protein TsetseEP domain-containing protein n=1 Tax=Drosophila navojoa TaxID=7232 RepID=A0A484BB32_DRONA|nr:hypothetical protein AWZ03_008582 [Drosophila navojoa]
MQVKIVALLAIVLVAQQVDAGTITFGDLMGDISKVAVAGEKVIHQLEKKLTDAAQSEVEHVETAMQNMLSDMANGLGDLANALTNLRAQRDYVQPEQNNLLGGLMGDMGNALGHLAGAQAIASAAHAAAPYVKQLNAALGDLANSLTHL